MSIDWQEIHQRLESTWLKISSGSAKTPDEIKNILKARAQLFAYESNDQDEAGNFIELLEFRLADENYGIEISYIQEVQPLKSYVTLSGLPPFVTGIVNVRGQVYSLVDIKKFFELSDKGISDLNKVIIIQENNIEFGILADSIIGVKSVSSNDLQSTLPTLTGIRQKYLLGVTPEHLIVLDAGKILSDKNLVVNE